ncbi:ABC transporter substrate-binding protein [Actinoalloteichus hymeniacidonis]|uniref:ABC-type Fe3+-hydroxamate transport system, periplasmic component n=1 Tax=Actinoalloteichus hymeniacidonis TaxID=340345 RepID=A0AAC9HRJ7_9PSEU|nr:ABC transporter substrate-binding protein [Actinoalloteichus hymeniacidonis]AOS63926.1 ABC-type Fe3+-hydroxamate transport system, periplasmic component [Actinoalloteichus hymeniacidonis]MBB5908018.1 iron complex transport system substrate-binding protein [Actinoalloteichus hymeniacidonis]
MTMRPARRMLPLVAVSVLVATACGAEISSQTADGTTEVTIDNCGRETTYPRPQRPVVYEGGGAEKLFVLGLADQVHGWIATPTNDPAIERSPYREDFERIERLSNDLLNREIVVDAEADWVFAGWNSGFSEERGITPQLLDDLGIASYMHTESCYNFEDGSVNVTPLEGLYIDLADLGEIFGVEERAEEVVTDLRERIAALESDQPTGEAAEVFVYDSGTDQPFTAAAHAPPNDIIAAAGGRNILADLDERWTSVGWESVIEAQPEVIVIIDYGDLPAEDKIEFLRTHPALESVPAVAEEQFYVLNYGEAISGPRMVDGAEKFAEYLRSIGR